MRYRRGQQPISRALGGFMGAFPEPVRLLENMTIAYWDEVVGADVARVTQPMGARDGCLVVATKSSVWSHHLSLMREPIRVELNRRVGRPVLKNIVFRLGAIQPKDAPPAQIPSPTDDELSRLALTDLDMLKLDEWRARLCNESELIQLTTMQLTERQMRIHRWRAQQGWKPCAGCGVLQYDSAHLCPVCTVLDEISNVMALSAGAV